MLIACVDTVHKDSLSNRLNDQRKDGQFCDVLLKISGQALPTHSCVLSASSPFFRELICGGERSNPPHLASGACPQEIELALPDVMGTGSEEAGGLEAVVLLLDYIYTGKINLRQDDVELVVRLAEAFMLDSLSTLIRNHMHDSRSPRCPAKEVPPVTVRPTRSRQVVTLPIFHRRKLPRKLCVSVRPKPLADRTAKSTLRTNTLKCRKRPLPGQAEAGGTAGGPADASSARKRSRVVVKRIKLVRPKQAYAFKCKRCSFVSDDGPTIRAHKIMHPGQQYACVGCDYVTLQSAKLMQHLLVTEHPQTRCSLCQFESDDPVAFRQHLLREHDPGKPHYCRLCDFKCGSKSQLNAHTMKHSTERPFLCTECNRGFKWKKGLQTHMVSHSKEKPFMCDKCDFRTAYSSVLAMHLRIHTGDMLTCPHEGCNFQAYSKRHITKHGLTHNKDKPYVCEICGQKYAQIESLRRHSKIHNPDTKILRCELCPYSTTRQDKMTEHSKKSHNSDRPTKSPNERSTKRADSRRQRAEGERAAKKSSLEPAEHPAPRSENHHVAAKSRGSDQPLRTSAADLHSSADSSPFFAERLPSSSRATEHYHPHHGGHHHHLHIPKRSSHGQQDPGSREHFHAVKDSQQHHQHHHFDQPPQQRADLFARDGNAGWDGADSSSQHHFLTHQQRESASAVAAMFVTTHLGLMDMVHP